MLDTIARTRPRKRLIVTKLDRLGRDAVDVMTTVKRLDEIDCQVTVLQLGDNDLKSSAGTVVLAALAAVAEMEPALVVERAHADLQRAKAEGKAHGRPRVTDDRSAARIRDQPAAEVSVAQIASDLRVSRHTAMRIRDRDLALSVQ